MFKCMQMFSCGGAVAGCGVGVGGGDLGSGALALAAESAASATSPLPPLAAHSAAPLLLAAAQGATAGALWDGGGGPGGSGGPNGGVVGIGGGALNPTVGLAAAAGGGRGADHELPPAGGRKPGCPGAAYEVAGPSTLAGLDGGTGHGHVHGTPDFKYWKMAWLDVTSCPPPPPAPPRRPSPAALTGVSPKPSQTRPYLTHLNFP